MNEGQLAALPFEGEAGLWWRMMDEGRSEQERVWSELDQLLSIDLPHPGGTSLSVASYAVDSGGHRTQAVYDYVRRHSPRAIAIKRSKQHGLPVIAGRPTWQLRE